MNKAHRFKTGKVSSEILKKVVFTRLGVPCNRIIKGPEVGEDAAVVDMGDYVLVIATDPITGAVKNVGWLVVHINANDVASTGARPTWFLCVTLLPETTEENTLKKIMDQINRACYEVDVSVVGGHTEITPGLNRPILIGFMLGEAKKEKYIPTGGAKLGDQIILTKGAGIEGTAILAGDLFEMLKKQMDENLLFSAVNMINQISVVPEAMMAVDIGGVHSLHDPTEGGVLNGIWEMAEASDVGVVIWESSVLISDETRAICNALEVDPLKLLGSGALLVVIDSTKSEEFISSLIKIDVKASVIGEITSKEKGRVLIRKDNSKTNIKQVYQDEVYRIFSKFGVYED